MLTALTIASPLFLVSGYLYSHFLLAAFGIDASLFLSLGDYVAASVDNIRYAAVSVAGGFVAMLLGIRAASKRGKLERALSKKVTSENLPIYGMMLVFAAEVAAGYLNDDPKFREAGFLGWLIFLFVSERLAEMFKKPLPALISIIVIGTFAIHLAVSLHEQIRDLRAGRWPRSERLRFEIPASFKPAGGDLILFAGSSDYVFGFDPTTGSAHVIPRSDLGIVTSVQAAQ